MNDPDAVIVVLSIDLMDRSKISAAFPAATVVRSIDKLIEIATSATTVLVDLNLVPDPSVLSEIEAPVIGFGSHVDEATLADAAKHGVEALPRSLFFRRLRDRAL